MRIRANILFGAIALIALATVSCQQTQPVWPVAYVPPAPVPTPEAYVPPSPVYIGYRGPVYGTPGTNSIPVLISGWECKKPGLYYLEKGATLDTVINISDNLNNPFGDLAIIEHWDKQSRKRYHIGNMSAEKRRQVILSDGDRISIIGSVW